jgi:hypothetical protein
MQTIIHSIREFNNSTIRPPANFVGRFTVIHKTGITRFVIYDLALKFYNELNEEATIWDVTNGYELLNFKKAR